MERPLVGSEESWLLVNGPAGYGSGFRRGRWNELAPRRVLRTVNHLTLGSPASGTSGWEAGDDLYGLIGELRTVGELRLPQACRPAGRGLQHLGGERAFRCDAGSDASPEQLAKTAMAALPVAEEQAGYLAAELDVAQAAVSHLYQ